MPGEGSTYSGLNFIANAHCQSPIRMPTASSGGSTDRLNRRISGVRTSVCSSSASNPALTAAASAGS